MSLLEDVSIVVTPNGYKAGTLYGVLPTYTEGIDLVDNGDFATDSDWTKGTGWSIANDKASYDGSGTGYQYILQSITTTSGKLYKINFDVLSSTGSNLNIVDFGSVRVNQTHLSAGNYTYYAEADASSENLTIYANGTDTFSIDNISVKEVTSSDMDVTRATAATRVDEDGLVNYAEILGSELVTDGNFPLPNTNWILGGSGSNIPTIGTNDVAINSVDGNSYVGQSGILTIGRYYKITYDVISASATSNVLKLASSFGMGSIPTSVGTQIVYGTAVATSLYIERYTNGVNATITNISAKEVTRDNVPRIDYTGGGCPHILAEPERTNLVPYSEDFNSWYAKDYVTVTEDTSETTSPSGNNTASKITINSVSTIRRLYEVVTTSSGSDYTFTLYAKKGTTDFIRLLFTSSIIEAEFNLTNGTVTSGTGSIESVGNDWYRLQATGTSSLTGEVPQIQLSSSASVNDYLYIWGCQVEEGSYATSYIPNFGTSAGVTRVQDVFTRDGIGSLINSTEGVLFVEAAALSNDSTYRGISLNKNDGTANNRIVIFFWNASNELLIRSTSNGVTKINETINLVSETDYNKIAVSYKLNDWKIYVNGSLEAAITNASALVFPSGTLDNLSFDSTLNSNPFFANVKQLQVYTSALTDEQLEALTS